MTEEARPVTSVRILKFTPVLAGHSPGEVRRECPKLTTTDRAGVLSHWANYSAPDVTVVPLMEIDGMCAWAEMCACADLLGGTRTA